MICRRCGKLLPEGETKLCPFCGIKQDTYIVPRIYEKYKRPKMQRGAFLSILSVAFVLFIVAMLIPFLRNYNKRALLNKIDAAYGGGDRETLNILYAQLQSSYPKAEEEIAETKLMLDELLGVTPSASAPSGVAIDDWIEDAVHRELEERTSNTREIILDILNIEISRPLSQSEQNLVLTWKNSASKNVAEIKFSAEGYDADGNAVLLTDSEYSRATLRSDRKADANSEVVSSFLHVWEGGKVTGIKLFAVSIRYEDDSTAYVAEDVLNKLCGN